jgi:hypothetical protein
MMSMVFVAHGLCQPSARVTSPAVCDLGKTQIPLFTVRQGCAVKCRSGLPTHQIPLPALQPWPPVRARLGNRQNQPPIPQFRSPAAAQPFCSSATVPQKGHLPGRAEADALRSVLLTGYNLGSRVFISLAAHPRLRLLVCWY